jgi:predicted NodU family carbamoyl transferase
MRVLGIHDGHRPAACIYEDGRLTAGIQEERLTRVKNSSGVPEKSIATVLDLAGLAMKDIDYVAGNGHHMPYPKDRHAVMEEYRATGSVPNRPDQDPCDPRDKRHDQKPRFLGAVRAFDAP